MLQLLPQLLDPWQAKPRSTTQDLSSTNQSLQTRMSWHRPALRCLPSRLLTPANKKELKSRSVLVSNSSRISQWLTKTSHGSMRSVWSLRQKEATGHLKTCNSSRNSFSGLLLLMLMMVEASQLTSHRRREAHPMASTVTIKTWGDSYSTCQHQREHNCHMLVGMLETIQMVVNWELYKEAASWVRRSSPVQPTTWTWLLVSLKHMLIFTQSSLVAYLLLMNHLSSIAQRFLTETI